MSYIQGTGRRKNAVARVYVSEGSGAINVNNKPLEQYFSDVIHTITVRSPFTETETLEKYDVKVNVSGGGKNGQAEAIRHGISRALCEIDEENFRPILKAKGFLTRDPRMVERKKAGLKKARKRKQFRKR